MEEDTRKLVSRMVLGKHLDAFPLFSDTRLGTALSALNPNAPRKIHPGYSIVSTSVSTSPSHPCVGLITLSADRDKSLVQNGPYFGNRVDFYGVNISREDSGFLISRPGE